MVKLKSKRQLLFNLFALSLTIVICAGSFWPAISKTAVITSETVIPTNQTAQIFGPQRYQVLAEADRFYKQGNLEMARKLQREVKPEFVESEPIPDPIVDTTNLSGAPKVYWRLANEGMEQDLESKIFEPLRLLTEQYPDFIPGHLLYVDALIKYQDPENPEEAVDQALEVLERVTSLYPNLKEPLDKKITLLVDNKRYLEASIAARQFSISYPDDPDAAKYHQIAEENSERYRDYIQQELMAIGVGNAIISGFTRNSSGASVIALLLEGEAKTGEVLAEQYKAQYSLVQEPAMVNYVNEVGQKLAKLMGRNEFTYEFFIVNDPSFNAFALPGGKVFINTGALLQMQTEAELAGLLGHEIAHSALSHSFQKMATNATLESFGQIVPFAQILTDIGQLEFSRELETQSDVLGTRAIATSGYSADGLYSVVGILKQLEGNQSQTPSWLSTHPANSERIAYLEQLINRNGYDRYAYEGVESYQAVFGQLGS